MHRKERWRKRRQSKPNGKLRSGSVSGANVLRARRPSKRVGVPLLLLVHLRLSRLLWRPLRFLHPSLRLLHLRENLLRLHRPGRDLPPAPRRHVRLPLSLRRARLLLFLLPRRLRLRLHHLRPLLLPPQ